MTDRFRIAVLGAGYVGTAVAREMARDPHTDVWAMRRSAPPADASAVTWLRGDVTSADLPGLPQELDAVVLTIAPSGGADAYETVYPPAAAAAVALARRTGARRLLYTSSTGVYGGRDGAWVTEASPRHGAGDANAALCRAEDVILAADVPAATVCRVAGIYGPGRDPRGRMRSAASLAQRGEYWTNLAHRDDIVAALRHLLRHLLRYPGAPGVLNVSDGAPTRAADVARWLAAAAGEDPAQLTFGNDAQRSRNDQRVSNAALVATGWAPRYPSFREGFTHGM